jgi:hypothetical protein
MLAALNALLLLASPIKLAVNGFTVVGIDQKLGDAYAERFVTLFRQNPALLLVSQRDIAQVLGLERQRELLGCSESTASCVAELAGALGVDAIFSGTLARGGSNITATLRIVRADTGTEVASSTVRLGDEDALQDWLDAQVPALTSKVLRAFGRDDPSAAVVTRSVAPSLWVRWLPAIGGAALAIAGAVLFSNSIGIANRLRSDTFASRSDAESLAGTGHLFEGFGAGMIITGAVAICASVLWAFIVPTTRAEIGVAF